MKEKKVCFIWTDLLKLTVDNNKCLLSDELSTVSTEFSTICINTVNKCMNMKKIPVNTGIMKKGEMYND